MPRQFILPDLGEGISEAQIVRVLVKPGDQVARDQYLMEVETDKAAVEIPSPYAGIARMVHVKDGQTVNVGDVIVTFDDGDGSAGRPQAKEPVEAAPAPKEETSAQGVPAAQAPPAGKIGVSAAPVVRKLARELGVDLSAVTGTGPGGRVTKKDVEDHAASAGHVPAASAAVRAVPVPQAHLPAFALPEGTADADKWGAIRRVPLNQIRKTIAKQMSRAAFTIPHVTHCDEADITELDRLRRDLNEATGRDPRLTAMTFLVKAVCIALRKYPIFNSSFDEEAKEIVYKAYVNMGIAVDTERGLIVPVIRNVDGLSLRGIAVAMRTIADKIRSSRFTVDDLRGGTFTISNVGALGGIFTTPIINYPEAAILSLGRSRQVPVIRNGEISEALMLPLSLSFDHRAADGANAARFTREIIGYLEKPAKFLLE